MKILYIALFILSSCLSPIEQKIQPSYLYRGTIEKKLQGVTKSKTGLTIALRDSIGVFISDDGIFNDSVHVVVSGLGYLFPSIMNFDSAFSKIAIIPINYSMIGNSISGSCPPDRVGFSYSFTCYK